MKKVIFSLLTIAMITVSCNKETEISASLTWNDSEYFDFNDNNWKASIYEDAINFLNDADYDLVALETKTVSVGDATVIFNIEVKSYTNYTIVVFNDENGNDKYDMGEMAGAKFDGVDKGEAATFDIEVSY